LLLVMTYDLLLGHGKIDGGGQVKRVLKEHEAKLRAEFARLKIRRGVAENDDLLPESLRAAGTDAKFALDIMTEPLHTG
jgi:putative methyltransferase